MDVHRSRFVPYQVHPITAVAFSRAGEEDCPPGLSQPALRLAIGRESGAIEIWNPRGGSWVQEAIFPGVNKSIDGLLWTREPDEDVGGHYVAGQQRLFSIASSPDVTEWDLVRGTPKKASTGNFSEVWCFAAQPRQPMQRSGKQSQKSQDIVAGCGDGSIALLSTADEGIQFTRFLARVSGKKAKCMSITYQTRDRILCGFADGSIRLLDTRNGSVLRTMSVGNGVPPAPKNKFVWRIKCLPNGDFASGDSNGDVCFWDGRSYTLTQRIKGHDSDCIDLVVSTDGKAITTGSLDGKVAVYHNVTNPSGRKSWAKLHHRRVHHRSEVKSMTVHDSPEMSVVVSGGSDLAPIIMPFREYGKENSRTLSHLPQLPQVCSARRARLLVSWSGKIISVWRMARPHVRDVGATAEDRTAHKLVLRIELKTKHNLTSVAISDDGKMIVAATCSEVKAFHLRRSADADALRVRSLRIAEEVASAGARLLSCSPDGKWLAIVNLEQEIHIVRVTTVVDKPKNIQILDKATELERLHRGASDRATFQNFERTINRIAFSPDSSIVAVADQAGFIDSWVLQGQEDPTAPAIDVASNASGGENLDDGSSSDSSDDDDDDGQRVYFGQHWAANPVGHLLPQLDSAALVLAFRPSAARHSDEVHSIGNPGLHSTRHNPHAYAHELPKGEHRLFVITAEHQMYEFEVLDGRLSDWSRRNSSQSLPGDFTKLRDRVMDCVWDVTPSRERIWLYGRNWMFMLNVGVNLQQSMKKRRSSHAAADADFKRQKTSGAGSKTIGPEREGLSARLARYDNGTVLDVDADKQSRPGERLDPDELDNTPDLSLVHMRSTDHGHADSGAESQATQDRQWWCTYKYRSILGMVPLDDVASTDVERPLEVVVVERPVWDILESRKEEKRVQ